MTDVFYSCFARPPCLTSTGRQGHQARRSACVSAQIPPPPPPHAWVGIPMLMLCDRDEEARLDPLLESRLLTIPPPMEPPLTPRGGSMVLRDEF